MNTIKQSLLSISLLILTPNIIAMEQKTHEELPKKPNTGNESNVTVFDRTSIYDVFDEHTWQWKKDSSGELAFKPFDKKNPKDSEYAFNARLIAKLPQDIQKKITKDIIIKNRAVFPLLELLVSTLTGHSSSIISAKFSPDNRQIITTSKDETAKVWDALTGHCLHTLEGHLSWVTAADFSPNNEQIVTIAANHTVRIWDALTGRYLHNLQGHTAHVSSVNFNPDSKQIVTGSHDRTAKIWDTFNGNCLHTLRGHTDALTSVNFSPDGKLVATASHDTTAKIWESLTGLCLHTLQGHTDAITSVDFTSDSKLLITTSEETLTVWNALNGLRRFTYQGIINSSNTANFSPDGTLNVILSDRTAKIINPLLDTKYFKKELTLQQALLIFLLYTKHQQGTSTYLCALDKRVKHQELNDILKSFEPEVRAALIQKYKIQDANN